MSTRNIIQGNRALLYLAAGAIVFGFVLLSCGNDGYGGGESVFLVSVSITPVNPLVSISGEPNQQFSATGTYSNYVMQNVTALATWSSSDTNIAVISNTSGSKGLATCINPGPATITAAAGYAFGTTILTCS